MLLLPQNFQLCVWHLAGGGCLLRCGVAGNNPSHRRIATEPVSVVDILISGNAVKSQWPPASLFKRKSRPKAASRLLDRLNPARRA
jgi:hypothetical protein